MYALASLTPDDALAFAPLAVATVRPTLARLATLPNVAGVGARLLGEPVGLVLAVTPPASDTARLLSLFVTPRARHAKTGTALMGRLASELRSRGVDALEALVPSDIAGASALDGLFSSLGWSEPTLDSLRCVAEHRCMLAAPWLRANRMCPPGYDIVRWVDVTDEERAAIRARQAMCPWFPADLDPFHHERELDVETSLALRHGGDVVGWMITHRMTPTVLSYTCGFVRHDLARRGRFIPLLSAALEREVATAPGVEHIGIWSTPAQHDAMVRFERSHMAPFSREIVETRRHVVRLDDHAVGAHGVRDVEHRTALPFAQTTRVTVENERDCGAVVARARSDHAHWPRIPGPLDIRRADDATTSDVLAPLLSSITTELSRTLGSAVDADRATPLANLFVVTANRLAGLPLAPLGAPAAMRCTRSSSHAPRVVTLPLAVPTGGAAWRCWALMDEETIGLTDVEVSALLDGRAETELSIQEGVLTVQDARAYRQLAAFPGVRDGELLILLQAMVEWTDGAGWVLHA